MAWALSAQHNLFLHRSCFSTLESAKLSEPPARLVIEKMQDTVKDAKDALISRYKQAISTDHKARAEVATHALEGLHDPACYIPGFNYKELHQLLDLASCNYRTQRSRDAQAAEHGSGWVMVWCVVCRDAGLWNQGEGVVR